MVKQLEPSFVVSFNYRHLISAEVLELLPGRIINLHTSFLPFNRGSAPNFFSFYENTPKGVTIHLMDSGLDTGDILCQRELSFEEDKETFSSTYDKLQEEMIRLFRENWADIRQGRIPPRRQEGQGTYHRMSDLEAVRRIHPFAWTDNIAVWKKGLQEEVSS